MTMLVFFAVGILPGLDGTLRVSPDSFADPPESEGWPKAQQVVIDENPTALEEYICQPYGALAAEMRGRLQTLLAENHKTDEIWGQLWRRPAPLRSMQR
ncbi:hypothetical protein [Mesorhizobium captivum]|uniref:hypothetical protein n=1 Tax=Mesorhizobium captivum TaxID=3072319 RepID=UPI002A24B13A|nr:hypothetical protein [Mesorhizobium sp. VK3C]MDX8448196.1 hypothetical protein [Mesorhizobium sp. VK3C]